MIKKGAAAVADELGKRYVGAAISDSDAKLVSTTVVDLVLAELNIAFVEKRGTAT